MQRIQALRSIDLAITGSLDLRVTLNILLDQVTTHLRVDGAAVLLLNSHTHRLEYMVGRGFRTTALQGTHLPVGEGYAGRAALERRLISIPNLLHDKGDFAYSPLFDAEGFVSYWAAPLITKGRVGGVLEVFHRAPLHPDSDWLNFLETLAGQAAIAIENAELFDDLQRSNLELQVAYDSTLEGWSKALDLRDRETEGHTQRVTAGTMTLAAAMNIPDDDLLHMRRGALLHDIGKMGIPDSILLKPGSLTPEEWVIMKMHPVYAYELLSPIHYLRPSLDVPYSHHEKWDGSGYPRGLKGEQIPLAARIFAVVDVWDALSSNRPYREAWPAAKVRDHICQGGGSHFDPHVLAIFLDTTM
jgi:HD-GYP domain-containing protein (c-di-GMP phosphodiesterase class II)